MRVRRGAHPAVARHTAGSGGGPRAGSLSPSWSSGCAAARRRGPRRACPACANGPTCFEYFIHHEDVRRAQPGWGCASSGRGRPSGLWRIAAPDGPAAGARDQEHAGHAADAEEGASGRSGARIRVRGHHDRDARGARCSTSAGGGRSPRCASAARRPVRPGSRRPGSACSRLAVTPGAAGGVDPGVLAPGFTAAGVVPALMVRARATDREHLAGRLLGLARNLAGLARRLAGLPAALRRVLPGLPAALPALLAASPTGQLAARPCPPCARSGRRDLGGLHGLLGRWLARSILRATDSLPPVSAAAMSRPPSMLGFFMKCVLWKTRWSGSLSSQKRCPASVVGTSGPASARAASRGSLLRRAAPRRDLHGGVHPHRLLGRGDVELVHARACSGCRASRRVAPSAPGCAGRRCLRR